MLHCVEESIDRFGSVAFQNACCVPVDGFLELLSFYLKSTYVQFEGVPHLQKQGVCIGSCIAPVLSDLFLASCDRNLSAGLEASNAVRVFRYVDDFLIVVNCEPDALERECANVLTVFREGLHPLDLTYELPVGGQLRFLDIRITFGNDGVCWCYEPRAKKPLLPYNSAHSKIVKRGIVTLCFKNALEKSCPHLTAASFYGQVERLQSAGYPAPVLTSVAEGLLGGLRGKTQPRADPMEGRQKVAVIPYMHQLSHNLRKMAQRSNVKVVFSAPNKLLKLCRLSDPEAVRGRHCNTKHRKAYVECVEGVVYKIPLRCNRFYVGQTGRCLNDRLREHANKVNNALDKKKKVIDGYLAQHCHTCGCVPFLDRTAVVKKCSDRITREIIEAELIHRLGQACVSSPSLALTTKELDFLRMRRV